MKSRWIAAACVIALATAACGCDPVGRGIVQEGVPELQLAKTVHPTHNPAWTQAFGPAASGNFHCTTVADFDGDGLPDLAAGGFDRRGIRVWLANGDGTWSGVDGPLHLGLPTGLASADVDGDGRLDLVVAGKGELPGVRVWLNVDGTTWKEGEPATITQSYTAVQLIDLDEDGYPDILASRETEGGFGGIGVWMNRKGKGWTGDIGPTADGSYNDIAVADFNNDGNLDIVGARWGNPGSLDVWHGNGHGAWSRAKEDPAIALNYQGVDVGDFNNDGFIDIVATAYRSDLSAFLFLNDRTDGWWTTPIPLAGKGSFWDATAADLNGDGLLDVAATSFDKRGVRCWLQLPRDEEEQLVPQFIEQSFRFPHKGIYYAIDTADFNGDGKPELLASSSTEGVKVWFQTDEQGALTVSPLARTVKISEEYPRPYGEVDEAPQDPTENNVFTTVVRDDGFTYSEYRIGVGDHLEIAIYEGRVATPIIETKVVEASGELLIPLASSDPIRVVDGKGRGLSPSQLRELLKKRLRDTLEDPSVAITVKEYKSRKASLLGEVRVKPNDTLTGPGRYVMYGKTRVLEFIARHGGFTDQADLSRVEVRRRDGEKRVVDLFKAVFQSKLSQDVVLDEGDVVTVPSTAMSERKVYLLGEVAEPGVYELQDRVRVLEALQLADSFTKQANRKQVIVIRGEKIKPELYEINILDMLKSGNLANNLLLEDGDIVFVPRNWIADLQEFYRWFLPGYEELTD